MKKLCCLIFVLFVCAFVFAACDENQKAVSDKAEIVSAEGITFENNEGFIAVPNTKESFSFSDIVTVSENATWAVSKDAYGFETSLTKSFPLVVGDNKIYIIVVAEDGVNTSVYPITVRRKQVYNLTFYIRQKLVDEQDIEEGGFATEPQIDGYKCEWEYSFDKPVVKSESVSGQMTAIEYSVTYDLAGGEFDGEEIAVYTVEDEINLPRPYRENFKFKGWFYGKEKVDIISGQYHENIVLRAEWKEGLDILIFERKDGTSEKLKAIAKSDKNTIEVKNFITAKDIPLTAEGLCEYDEVIMNNVSVMDLRVRFGYKKDSPDSEESRYATDKADEFQSCLYSYVNDHGGSLFTVGGDDDDGKANVYNSRYMDNSIYRQMLPVQTRDYIPSFGVIILIDRSGSMAQVVGSTGQSRLFWALSGAKACLNEMSERDYIGIISLDGESKTLLPLTPRLQESEILAAISDIEESGGGSIAANAIEIAGMQLGALKVEKKHIILVSDGALIDEEESINNAKENLANGITLSVVQIGGSAYSEAIATRLADAGDGRVYTDDNRIVMNMSEDVRSVANEISEQFEINAFNPIIETIKTRLLIGVNYIDDNSVKTFSAKVGGFYGSKIKSTAELILTAGKYGDPLYAQWNLGKGRVGSFMCDVGGKMSAKFTADKDGGRFIKNVVYGLAS